MIKVYGFPRSRTSRTLWMLAEIGAPYELVRIEPGEQGVGSPAFRALNPNAQVPAIDDDGLVMWESLAINLHLAKKYGGALGPADAAEDAHMTMWSLWAGTDFEPAAHDAYLHTLMLPAEKRDPAMLAGALERLKRPLGALDAALQRGDGFLVGRRLTVADFNAAMIAFYLRAAERPFAAYSAVAAWYDAIIRRPSYATMIALRDKG